MHPLVDPAVDFEEELVDEDVRADLLQHAAVRVDEADVAPAGDAEVRIAGLAGAVDRAAEHGHLEMLRVALQTPLDLFGERVDADIVAATAWARDHHRAALAKTERLEDLICRLRLLDRVGRERDADRVADPLRKEGPDAHRALDRPREHGPRLRDAEVERVLNLFRQHPVGADHGRHVARLDGDLEVVEVEALEQAHLLERRLDERLRLILLRELLEVLRQRAGVRADSHRDPLRLGRADDLGDLVRASDIAGVDANGRDSLLDRLQREARVEVDVCDDRHRREADDPRERFRVLRLRDGDADDLAARADERRDLGSRGGDVVSLRRRHRLDDHGCAAADRDAANRDLPLAGHPRFSLARRLPAPSRASADAEAPAQCGGPDTSLEKAITKMSTMSAMPTTDTRS